MGAIRSHLMGCSTESILSGKRVSHDIENGKDKDKNKDIEKCKDAKGHGILS